MKKEEIKKLNLKFSNELDKALKMILPPLAEAFTNIYGEQHREYIQSIINNIKWLYYIPENDLELLSTFHKKLDATNKDIIKHYRSYFRDLEIKYNALPSDNLINNKFIYRHYLIKSDLSETSLISNNITDALACDVPLLTILLDENNHSQNVILLPIYTITINQIIHEINHILIINTAAYTKEEIINLDLFETKESEELINDFIAFQTLKEFFRLGGQIPSTLKRFPMYSMYRDNDYIVKDYYQALKPLLLECLITKKFRLYKHIVGEENHTYTCDLMSYLLNYGPDREIESELTNLITIMKKRMDSYQSPNYTPYLAQLEQSNCKIRRLN